MQVDVHVPPRTISVTDPWITRHKSSQLVHASDGPAGSETINLSDHEIYGDASHPIGFRIGNGGAGYTGILRRLCDAFIARHRPGIRIAWVPNHSRHSQLALLADAVQVALTYEPVHEDVSVAEGWARRVGRVCHDHFILVGPSASRHLFPAATTMTMTTTLRRIAQLGGEGRVVFHSRGDGSATFAKEVGLWRDAGVVVMMPGATTGWMEVEASTPYEALVKAQGSGGFLLTDRSTFLTACRDGVVEGLRTYVQGEEGLLNPCSAMVRVEGIGDEDDDGDDGERKQQVMAREFAEWLVGSEAQGIVRDYGKEWRVGKALYTTAEREEFDEGDLL